MFAIILATLLWELNPNLRKTTRFLALQIPFADYEPDARDKRKNAEREVLRNVI